MAISYPLTLPSTALRSIRFRALSTVGMSVSPFTKSQQLFVHPGETWEADLEFKSMSREEAEVMIAFLLALNGREGTFLAGDPINGTPRGVATGAPLVAGAGQTGKTLITDGWTPSTTGILKAGDWLQLGSGASTHLHKLAQDANSDGSGVASLEIWPRLRASPNDNDAVTVFNAKGLWRLASNARDWDIGLSQRYGLSFSIIEALG